MKKLSMIGIVAILSAGCHSSPAASNESNRKVPATTSAATGQGENSITFKVNGEPVRTSAWSISRFTTGADPDRVWLNITTNMKQEKRTFNVNLNGSTPGTYSFEEALPALSKSHGAFYPDYLGDMGTSYSFKRGSFIIQAIDTVQNTVDATFQGTVGNLKGDTIEITEGKITDGLLNRDVIRY